jgi:cytochrome c556
MMRNHRIVFAILAFVAIGSATSINSPARGEDDLAAFMKVKLRHAEKVLEGLATEDYELIVKNSQAISLLCEDEMWAVLQTPEYRERSREFRRSVDAITEAARSKNLEAAALSYVDSTMKCVSCHKYVRKTRSAR